MSENDAVEIGNPAWPLSMPDAPEGEMRKECSLRNVFSRRYREIPRLSYAPGATPTFHRGARKLTIIYTFLTMERAL